MDNNLGQEKGAKFICEICDYNTSRKYHLERHFNTERHKDKCTDNKKDQKGQEKGQQFFSCESCHYNTSHKSKFDRHLLTDKHFLSVERAKCSKRDKKGQEKGQNNINNKFSCICGNIYKYQSGLTKHKKVCNLFNNQIVVGKNELFKNDLIKELLKENKELKEYLINSKPTTQNTTNNNTTNNTNNTNTTNNNFNLKFFLNVECKDALNIKDFVNNIQLQLKDLEKTGELGYVNGISSIFINALKDLDITKRPIHCSDVKRETLYIKDNNTWEKENEKKEKIKDAIKKISHKNIKLIPLWKEENPTFLDSSTISNDNFLKIVKSTMNASTDEESEKNIDKIITKISKEIIINKN